MLSRTAKVAMRREVILGDLRHHPLSTTREISDRICEESGGHPTLVTGGLWIPPWTILSDLYALERSGHVQRLQIDNTRSIAWLVTEESA